MKLRVVLDNYALIWPVIDPGITVGDLTAQITHSVGLDGPGESRRFPFEGNYQLPPSAPVGLVLKNNEKIHQEKLPVPPGSGLKRTQSRNARRKIARQQKQAQQPESESTQVNGSSASSSSEDDNEGGNDDKSCDDKSSSSDETHSSNEDESSSSSDNSSSSSSSSSDEDDAPPPETFNVTSKKPKLYHDATTLQPYRVYRDRLELESVELNTPGEFPLRVPAPSAETPFTQEAIADPRDPGTTGKRPRETRVPFARPFDPAPYTLVPAQLHQLRRGQVVRFGMLEIKPGEMVPSFEENLCALVLEPAGAEEESDAGEAGDAGGAVTVQLASQFISLEPVSNRFTNDPPRYDYGKREITAASINNLRVYDGPPPLAIYPSMFFEASLDDQPV